MRALEAVNKHSLDSRILIAAFELCAGGTIAAPGLAAALMAFDPSAFVFPGYGTAALLGMTGALAGADLDAIRLLPWYHRPRLVSSAAHYCFLNMTL